MPRRWRWSVLILLLLGFSAGVEVSAQGNILNDPGFEGTYTGRGRADFNIPEAWGGWFTETPRNQEWMNIPPIAFPHTADFKRAGAKSLHVNRGGGTFTSAIYQNLTVAPGTILNASAWGFIENAGGSEAKIRIGIAPNGGTNPFAEVVWSGWSSAVNSWNQVSVQATAASSQITVFLYATQSWPNDPNGVYWDEASLVATGSGEIPESQPGGETGGETGGGAVPALNPPAVFAPFVAPQGEDDSGTIIHTVQTGDTIDAIAVAYGVERKTILDLNNITNPSLLAIGQQLIVKQGESQSAPEEEPTQPPAGTANATGSETIGDTEAGQPEDNPTEIAQEPTEVPPPPATPTEAPPAPVVSLASGAVVPAANPATLSSAVCVLLFEDANRNRIQEAGEKFLADGHIRLADGSTSVGEYDTDGVGEPHCFTDLAVGNYVASASAPAGYGLTTPGQLSLQIQPGVTINLALGAAEGVEAVVPPPADSGGIVLSETTGDEPDTSSAIEQLFDMSGLIIFGLAGVVLVGGLSLTFIVRRR